MIGDEVRSEKRKTISMKRKKERGRLFLSCFCPVFVIFFVVLPLKS